MITLKYEKPQISVAGLATSNIQNQMKGTSAFPDRPEDESYTVGAYQADE